jgi:hypothetical protein
MKDVWSPSVSDQSINLWKGLQCGHNSKHKHFCVLRAVIGGIILRSRIVLSLTYGLFNGVVIATDSSSEWILTVPRAVMLVMMKFFVKRMDFNWLEYLALYESATRTVTYLYWCERFRNTTGNKWPYIGWRVKITHSFRC